MHKNGALVVFLAAAALLFSGCASQAVREGMTLDGRAYRGAANPKLTIYEYSDFECPYCGKAQAVVEEVLRAYPDTVQLQFRHYPLDIHPHAQDAAVAAVCAEEQGKFWRLHDAMYSNQNALEGKDLRKYAQEAGLDMGAFEECIVSGDAASLVQSDAIAAIPLGIDATPTFIMGESSVRGAQPFSMFKQVIDAELARAG